MRHLFSHSLRKIGYFGFCISSVSACANSGMRIYSQPEQADVFQVKKGQAPVKIGVTPLTIDARDLPSPDGDGVTLRLVKEGHLPETLVLPKNLANSSISIHALLQGDEANRACEDQNLALRVVADGVAKAQTLIAQKRYEEAEQTLKQLALVYPSVSVIYDLLGNIYYVQKDTKKSFDAYKRSQKIWPNNIETNRMVQKLESMAAGRTPTGEGF